MRGTGASKYIEWEEYFAKQESSGADVDASHTTGGNQESRPIENLVITERN